MIMKKIAFTLLSAVLMLNPGLYAQKAVLQAVSKTSKVTARETQALGRMVVMPPMPGTLVHPTVVHLPNVSPVSRISPLTPTIPTGPVAKVTTPSISGKVNRSWWEQQQRNRKAAALKKQHTAQVNLAQRKASLPQLLENNKQTVSSFENLEVHQQEIPTLPWIEEPQILYRGLGLPVDAKAVRNILENGLLVKDVGPESNTLATIYAAGSRASLSHVAHVRYTNLTNDPSTALHYAGRNNVNGQVIVLVRVTGIADYKDIVRVEADIPPAQIEEMLVLVSLDGHPQWCRVELKGNQLELTPYEVTFGK